MVKGFWIGFIILIIALFLMGCATDVEQEEKPQVTTINSTCGDKPVSHIKGLHTVLVTSNPSYLTWEDIKGDRRKQFLAAFNASPPVSNVPEDSLVRLYQRFDSLNFFIVITDKDSCIITTLQMPRPQVLLWLHGTPTVPRRLPIPKPEKGSGV
mgnify:CR=1 FL=1